MVFDKLFVVLEVFEVIFSVGKTYYQSVLNRVWKTVILFKISAKVSTFRFLLNSNNYLKAILYFKKIYF